MGRFKALKLFDPLDESLCAGVSKFRILYKKGALNASS